MVPSSMSGTFFKRYLDGIEHVLDNGIFYVNCSARGSMKDLWFMFDEHWIQIKASDLLT